MSKSHVANIKLLTDKVVAMGNHLYAVIIIKQHTICDIVIQWQTIIK